MRQKYVCYCCRNKTTGIKATIIERSVRQKKQKSTRLHSCSNERVMVQSSKTVSAARGHSTLPHKAIKETTLLHFDRFFPFMFCSNSSILFVHLRFRKVSRAQFQTNPSIYCMFSVASPVTAAAAHSKQNANGCVYKLKCYERNSSMMNTGAYLYTHKRWEADEEDAFAKTNDTVFRNKSDAASDDTMTVMFYMRLHVQFYLHRPKWKDVKSVLWFCYLTCVRAECFLASFVFML